MALNAISHCKISGESHERPWVYFMIDSFFLVTQFFVLTFQVRMPGDLVLPNDLVHGSSCPPPIVLATPLAVTVLHNAADEQATYVLNGGEALDAETLVARLTELVQTNPARKYQVRAISEGQSVFKDVMVIMNACRKLGLAPCGIQPARGPRV